MNFFTAALHARVTSIMADRRAAMPHIVPQLRLLQSEVGDAFYLMVAERRKWIAENCVGEYMLDELRDANGVKIGRAFRFSDYHSAFHFRVRF